MPRKIIGEDARRQLNARAKRALERRLPWPYNGMVSDLTSAIQGCCNYLAALGLICYSEICGRQWFFAGNAQTNGYECLLYFLKDMGAGSVLQKIVSYKGETVHFSDAVRNGLVHEYFLKSRIGSVAMTCQITEALRTGFHIPSQDEVHIFVIPYFNLFCDALERRNQRKGLLQWRCQVN